MELTKVFLWMYLLQVTMGDPALTNNNEIVVHELTFRILVLVFTIVTYLLYRFGKWIYHTFIEYKLMLPVKGKGQKAECHIYLELTSPHDKVVLYLMTIPHKLINITFDSQTSVTVTSFTRRCLYAYLHLHWYRGTFLIHRTMECHYAPRLAVSIPLRRRVKRMVNSDIVCRILLLDDVYYAYKPLCSVFKKDASTSCD